MEKHVPPSTKKLRTARERGEAPRSEVISSVGAILGFGTFSLSHHWLDDLAGLSGHFVELHRVDATDMFLRFTHGLLLCGETLGVASLYMATGALLAGLATTGVAGNGFAATARFEHLGLPPLVAKVKSAPAKVIKHLLCGFVFGGIVLALSMAASYEVATAMVGNLSVPDAIAAAWRPVLVVLRGGVFFLIFFGGFEICSARRRFRKKMSMSLLEQRDEAREEYGDPQVRRARRELWQGLANADLESRIRRSKVIIVDSISW